MHISRIKLVWAWLLARGAVLIFVGVVFAAFFIVYALYGYDWGVAGYAMLLCVFAGLGFAARSYVRFAARYHALRRVSGRFPTSALPEPNNLLDAEYGGMIEALEKERARLERENEHIRRDAEEYYLLWAHQVKTPMAAMRLILQSSGDKISTACRQDIEQELFRIGQYVDMALQYQRLSSIESDLLLKELALAALVKQAAKNCAQLFIYKGLSLVVEEVQGTIVTDEKWFCFVLEQLYTNAVKYTPEGGAVRVYAKDAVTLVVEDTGIGISAEDLPRVFERGFTGAVGRRERSSTGIGLYLCREIFAKLGFSITIESAQACGTRVLLHLTQSTLEVD